MLAVRAEDLVAAATAVSSTVAAVQTMVVATFCIQFVRTVRLPSVADAMPRATPRERPSHSAVRCKHAAYINVHVHAHEVWHVLVGSDTPTRARCVL